MGAADKATKGLKRYLLLDPNIAQGYSGGVTSPKGWYVEEYVGVSVVNAWLRVPQKINVRRWRWWNMRTQYVGFIFSPKFNAEGQYLGMYLTWSNPLVAVRKKMTMREIRKKECLEVFKMNEKVRKAFSKVL